MIKYVKHTNDTIEDFSISKLENSIKDSIDEIGNVYTSFIHVIIAKIVKARLSKLDIEIVTTEDIIREVDIVLNNCDMPDEAQLYVEKYRKSIPM